MTGNICRNRVGPAGTVTFVLMRGLHELDLGGYRGGRIVRRGVHRTLPIEASGIGVPERICPSSCYPRIDGPATQAIRCLSSQEERMIISFRLDDRLARRLGSAARAQGISKAELIRRCLHKCLAGKERKSTAWELGKHLFGCYKSGRGDLSRHAREIAGTEILARHRRP